MTLYPLTTLVLLMIQLMVTLTEYRCLCVFDDYVHPIYKEPNVTSDVLGFLPANQCKYFLYPVNAEFGAIMVFHRKGFIHMKTPGMVQTCEGDPSSKDILTTMLPFSTQPRTDRKTNSPFVAHSSAKPNMTTPTTTSVTTQNPTNTPTAASTLTFSSSITLTAYLSTTLTTTSEHSSSTFSPTSVTSRMTAHTPTHSPKAMSSTNLITSTLANRHSVPEGHINACPDYIRNTDVNRFHGFLGQYGNFCYELVDSPTQWASAERHCALVSEGHLVHVLSQEEQDYVVRFLSKHHYLKGIWLGLTDSGDNNIQEGNWRWSSGAPFRYNNFQGDYAQHSSSTTHMFNDCILFKQGGKWTDVSCGSSLVLGLGFGETHPYICQYNISGSLPSVVEALPHVVVG